MSAAGEPRVSVVMGAYNCAATLDEAIESIVAQTHPHWELVVCDDASTDGTYERLLGWQERMPERIRVLRNETNRKLSHTLNRCLEEVTGALVARMDGDDVSVPERFARQVEYLGRNPEVDLVGTAMRRFNADGLADVVTAPEKPDRWTLRRHTPFCHATIMAKREVYTALNGYVDHPRVERTEDLDLWFRFFEHGFVGRNLGEPLYLVREDILAIRRRSVRNRWHVLRTNLAGYRRLGYPLQWYLRPVLAFAKVLVPARGAELYRKVQKRRFDRGSDR